MLFFNDLQLWERQNSVERKPYTNLLVRLGPRDVNSASNLPPMHNFSSSADNPKFGDSLMIPEIIERIAQISSEHWLVFNFLLIPI